MERNLNDKLLNQGRRWAPYQGYEETILLDITLIPLDLTCAPG